MTARQAAQAAAGLLALTVCMALELQQQRMEASCVRILQRPAANAAGQLRWLCLCHTGKRILPTAACIQRQPQIVVLHLPHPRVPTWTLSMTRCVAHCAIILE